VNTKTLRSLSLGVIALARQFGVRITVEQLEKKISQGQISSEKELKKYSQRTGGKSPAVEAKLKNSDGPFILFPLCGAYARWNSQNNN
jgi:hypothetical protein